MYIFIMHILKRLSRELDSWTVPSTELQVLLAEVLILQTVSAESKRGKIDRALSDQLGRKILQTLSGESWKRILNKKVLEDGFEICWQ